jgi:VWFA-related protein
LEAGEMDGAPMTRFSARLRWILAFLVFSIFSGAGLTAQSDAGQPPSSSSSSSSPQNPSPAEVPLAAHPAPPIPTEAQYPAVTIRETVRRVVVDVMVRDVNGKPVRGLTAGDFSITEDKRPQRVLSFDVYDFDKASIARAPKAPPLPPNVFENVPAAPERGPLYVMLLDLVNTALDDQMTSRAQVLKFIRSKPAGTRFAVFVTSDKLYLAQGFTDDKDLLYAAVNAKKPKAHVPRVFLMGRNSGANNAYSATDMLTHIGEYLDGIPGRKNLIWLAGTFPLSSSPEEGNSPLSDIIKAEMNALAQADVAVFPVELTGVDPNPAVGSVNASQGSAENIAAATGGLAFYNTNDVVEAMTTATEAGGNYYTLTYSPPSQEDEKCHKISVKLDKGSDQLSYRHSYCRGLEVSAVGADTDHPAAATLAVPMQAADVLQGNIKAGAPMLHDLVFSAHLQPGAVALASPAQMAHLEEQAAFFGEERRNRPLKPLAPVKVQTFTIDYRVLDPLFKAQTSTASGKEPTLEFAVAAFDEDGKVLNGVVNDAVPEASSQPAENKAGLYRARQALVVPVNATSIRVGVRDRANDHMGTLEVPLPLAPRKGSTAH